MFILLMPTLAMSQTTPGKVIAEITNLQPREGQILLSVYTSEDGYPGDEDKAFKKMVIPVTPKKCVATIELQPGTYAISLVHDINKDMKVEKNFLGIPKEPLGMSNYEKMARPKFDKAKFEVKSGQTVNLIIPVDTIF